MVGSGVRGFSCSVGFTLMVGLWDQGFPMFCKVNTGRVMELGFLTVCQLSTYGGVMELGFPMILRFYTYGGVMELGFSMFF